MSTPLAKISRINKVKISFAKGIVLALPEQEDLSYSIILEYPRSINDNRLIKTSEYVKWLNDKPELTTPLVEIPLESMVKSHFLLTPEEIDSSPDIPLIYTMTFHTETDELIPIKQNISTTNEFTDWFIHNESNTSAKEDGVIGHDHDRFDLPITDNLFQKLTYPKTVSGIIYADRYWKSEKVPEFTSNTAKYPINNQRSQVRPKDLNQVEGKNILRPRSKPNFWDLLFVLLQPPLEFGKTESFLLPSDLYPYQIEGVNFLVANNHALLADDMGTGKTVMTLVALKLLMRSGKVSKALIICPPSVLFEWQQHIADWTPEMVACLVRGVPNSRKIEWNTPAHIYLTSYDTLRSDVRNGIMPRDKWNSFDVVVVDEAHHIKNLQSDRSRAINKLTPIYRWALTGTPIQNKIEDMAAIFQFVYPGYITQFDFYEERIKNKVKPYFLRRRKQDVLKDLPPKIKQDLWLDMSGEQRQEYVRAEREIISEIEEIGERITKQHILAKIQRLKQICNFPLEKGTSPKLDILKEQIEEISLSGNKVIVFTQYIDQGTEKLVTALSPYGVAVIQGGQSDSVRRIEIEKFKNSDKTPILIASLRSGGEGLNLAEASYVVHFDHWWNPAVMWQAEDRVHRRGQKQKVNIYSYWMNDTIDVRIYQILKRKGLLIENVVDGLSKDTIDELLTMNDLLEIVGVKRVAEPKPIFDPLKWQKLTVDQIRSTLFVITAREFEELVERLMHYLGYPNVMVTQRSHDRGIDVLSTRLTGQGVERIAAQCKRYNKPIGVQIAREFLGAIQDDESIVKGYLITTSDFSSECIAFCTHHRIEMIPGIKIAEYVKRFGLEI